MSYFPGLNRLTQLILFRRPLCATAPDGSSFAGCRACRVAPVDRRKPEGFCGIGAQYDGSVHACVRSGRVAASRRFARRPHGLRWPATATLASARPRLLVGARKRCHCRHDIGLTSKHLRISLPAMGLVRSVARSCLASFPGLSPGRRVFTVKSCFQDHPDHGAASYHCLGPRSASSQTCCHGCDRHLACWNSRVIAQNERASRRRVSHHPPVCTPLLGVPALQGLTGPTLQRISPPLPSRSCRTARAVAGASGSLSVVLRGRRHLAAPATSRPRAFFPSVATAATSLLTSGGRLVWFRAAIGRTHCCVCPRLSLHRGYGARCRLAAIPFDKSAAHDSESLAAWGALRSWLSGHW